MPPKKVKPAKEKKGKPEPARSPSPPSPLSDESSSSPSLERWCMARADEAWETIKRMGQIKGVLEKKGKKQFLQRLNEMTDQVFDDAGMANTKGRGRKRKPEYDDDAGPDFDKSQGPGWSTGGGGWKGGSKGASMKGKGGWTTGGGGWQPGCKGGGGRQQPDWLQQYGEKGFTFPFAGPWLPWQHGPGGSTSSHDPYPNADDLEASNRVNAKLAFLEMQVEKQEERVRQKLAEQKKNAEDLEAAKKKAKEAEEEAK